MGLLYLFPVSPEEKEQVQLGPEREGLPSGITLHSYNLPAIFWVYLLMILGVILTMYLLIKGPLESLSLTEDPLNKFLAQMVLTSLWITPLGLLGFFFFRKSLSKQGQTLEVKFKLFFIPIRKKTYTLQKENPFLIRHFLDSPNIARRRQDSSLQGFMNKGYFELMGKLEDGRTIFIDRHSRKADLVQIQELLGKY